MTDSRAGIDILVVDDEPSIVLALTEALREDAVAVHTASRIDAAEQELARRLFSLAIVDVHLRGFLGEAGLELLSYIKHHWPQTKVLVMTAYGTPETRQDAFDRGADYYYEKPFDLAEIRNILLQFKSAAHRN